MAASLKPEPIRRRGVRIEAWIPAALRARAIERSRELGTTLREVIQNALAEYLKPRDAARPTGEQP